MRKHLPEPAGEIREITRLDPEYPERLKNIPAAPRTLYVRGSLPPEDMPSVAIIGARSCTEYGYQLARSFARALSARGVLIISGMAYGIDSAAHWGAVDSGKPTCAVFGCGLDICYPARNYSLHEKILRSGGCVLSEYPPGVPPLGRHFAARNRIISGLADAVLVVEAREHSGTSITVNAALEQGRQIFAVPGRVTDLLSAGCNQMIRDGAALLTCPEELLEYLHLSAQEEQLHIERDIQSLGLTGAERKLWEAMDYESRHIDQIMASARISLQQATEILLRLEILGFTESPKNGFYRKRMERWK